MADLSLNILSFKHQNFKHQNFQTPKQKAFLWLREGFEG